MKELYSEKSTNKNNPRADWVYFGISYLWIALAACNEMLNPKDGKEMNEYLYIATIYNIKHAIEILEKLLLVTLEETGKLDKGLHKHDIKLLLIKVKHKIPKKFWPDLMILSEVIDKYHHLSFLINKLDQDFSMEDCDNSAFRFPQNNLSIHIDYEKLLDKITSTDIENLKNDIPKIQKFFDIWKELSSFMYRKNPKG